MHENITCPCGDTQPDKETAVPEQDECSWPHGSFSTPDGGSLAARGPSKRADCSEGEAGGRAGRPELKVKTGMRVITDWVLLYSFCMLEEDMHTAGQNSV